MSTPVVLGSLKSGAGAPTSTAPAEATVSAIVNNIQMTVCLVRIPDPPGGATAEPRPSWLSIGRRLDCRPHPGRRHRHVEMAHAQRRERVVDCIEKRRKRA